MFDFTSQQRATDNHGYPEKGGDLLRLEPNLSCPLDNVTERKKMGERLHVKISKVKIF